MYDEIADLYHLVYDDWDAAIAHQASALDQVISELIGCAPHFLLDVSCGIGTQTLGLAARNYQVSAADLSAGAIARARREAHNRGLSVNFSVADMRDCAKLTSDAYDVLLSADNSITHLAGPSEMYRAVKSFFDCLRPGGIALVGIRDYVVENDRTSPQMQPYGFREHAGYRYFVFQTRDIRDDGYEVAMYFVREATGAHSPKVIAGRSRYYYIHVNELIELFSDAGFEEVRRIDKAMHQPLIAGQRPET